MKKFNIACSIVAVFTIAIFLITVSQNLVVRSAEVYSFYFNDSGAVSKLYTDLSTNEVADGIAGFMNSWRPSEFQIYEDTGYDMQGIFTEEEGANMMQVKKWIDISAILCAVSLILTIAIYWHLIKSEDKAMLRRSFRIAMGISLVAAAGEVFALLSHQGREWIANFIKLIPLPEDSPLLIVLGPEFLSMATGFLVLITVIVFIVCAYLNYRLTKPPRIFY